MTESELVDYYTNELMPYFRIWHEVDGRSIISGARKRIDMIIESREIPPKRVQSIRFGIEFKTQQMESMNNYTAWLRQAIGYTQCEWGIKKARLPILVAPFINRDYCEDLGRMQCDILTRLAGQFGIGELGMELRRHDDGGTIPRMVIRMCDTRFWSSDEGWNASMAGMNFSKRYEL